MFKISDKESVIWNIPFADGSIKIQNSPSLIMHKSGDALFHHLITYTFESADWVCRGSYTNFNSFEFKSMEYLSNECKEYVKEALEKHRKENGNENSLK